MLTQLKFLRLQRFRRAQDFAKAVGISRGYLSKLEEGTMRNPSPKIRKKIARLLNVDEKILF